MDRRICFPISDAAYAQLNEFCNAKKLTRGQFYNELMAAFLDKRAPCFGQEPSSPGRPQKVMEPYAEKPPIRGGGTHSM